MERNGPSLRRSYVILLTTVAYNHRVEPNIVLLGKRITEARERRGWSRADLARRAAVDPSYVTRIEEAHYKRPSVDKVTQLAGALGIRVTDLTDPSPVPVSGGIEAELRALFEPSEAPLVAEILRSWARHDEPTRRFLLETLKPLILGFPSGAAQAN
jgi:transcriptional regulator with XRE-family HTH domain